MRTVHRGRSRRRDVSTVTSPGAAGTQELVGESQPHWGPSEGSEEAGSAAALGALHAACAFFTARSTGLRSMGLLCWVPHRGAVSGSPGGDAPRLPGALQGLPEGSGPTGRLGRRPFQADGATMAEPSRRPHAGPQPWSHTGPRPWSHAGSRPWSHMSPGPGGPWRKGDEGGACSTGAQAEPARALRPRGPTRSKQLRLCRRFRLGLPSGAQAEALGGASAVVPGHLLHKGSPGRVPGPGDRRALGWATAKGWARRNLGVCGVCLIQLAHLHQCPTTARRRGQV